VGGHGLGVLRGGGGRVLGETADEEVVGFDVAVDEVSVVDGLDSGDLKSSDAE
jgi:hypothetical protein